jgi:hypothetical protein
MIALDLVILYRKDDSTSREYREVILYQDGGHCEVWEIIGFIESPETGTRGRIQIGSEMEMKDFFQSRVEDLQTEGFTKIEAN